MDQNLKKSRFTNKYPGSEGADGLDGLDGFEMMHRTDWHPTYRSDGSDRWDRRTDGSARLG